MYVHGFTDDVQAGLVSRQGYIPTKKFCKSNKKLSFKTVYFLGVSGLTTSSHIVYDNTTSGHMDLQTVYLLYIMYNVYPFLYSMHTFLYNTFIYF